MKKLLVYSTVLFAITNVSAGEIKENMTIMHNGLEYKTVKSPKTSKIWLDRNLGATQVCQSSTDKKCYGDLFQWGRGADGHEKRGSKTTKKLSSKDVVNHSEFITPRGHPVDWKDKKTKQLTTLRQNPCPKGFTLPTTNDFVQDTVVSGARDAQGVAKGFLKLPLAGHRDHWGGDLLLEGLGGYYWTSTHDRDTSFFFFVNKDNVNPFGGFRAFGFSVRCIAK